jgi:heme/copper-type cytochrome/quinol oxidase subunit 3
MFVWFKDVVYEGLSGYHGFFVQDGLKYGIFLFIFREFMFFFCVFWVFFDASLVLIVDTGDS